MNDKTHTEHRLTLNEVLDLLLADGLVVAEDVSALKEERKRYTEKIHPLVVVADQNWRNTKLPARLLTIEVLSEWLANQVGLPYMHIDPLKIDFSGVGDVMSSAYATRFSILPVQVTANEVVVATAEPYLREWERELAPILRKDIRRVMASPADIERYLVEFFNLAKSVKKAAAKGEVRWNFGANAALTFPGGGNPVSTPGSAMNTFEGCASIGLPNGNLAFYTSGATIWGANNVPMPNGMGLFGNSSTTQAAIIVPRPGMANRYYVFCSSSNFSPGTLSYSEVDMTLNAPWGNVIAGVKNIVIQNNISEKLTAVRHCNGIDVWVIVHDYTNSDYKAFLVTATGVSLTPVVSSAGAPTSGNVVGAMKVSPNGKKIAYCASNSPFALHVADFNNSTGVINNVNNLAGNAGLVPMYGLEFSPDSKILYGSK